MGVRIRKLAKELKRSPDELIGILTSLGYQRYRSPEDMLADSVASTLRQKVPKGTFAPSKRRAQKVDDAGLMGRLVPGIVPLGGEPREKLAQHSLPQAQATVKETPSTSDVKPNRSESSLEETTRLISELEDAQRQLKIARDELDAQAARHAAELHDLSARHVGEMSAQAALHEGAISALTERMSEATTPVPANLPSLMDLLEERGLLGADECSRGIAALADHKLLRDILPLLRVEEADAVESVLQRNLLLVGGKPIPVLESLYALVSVAPGRGDVSGAEVVQRAVESLGEELLLAGFRHLFLVETRPHVVRCLTEFMDPRVQIHQLGSVPRAELVSDSSTKVVFVWGAEVSKELEGCTENTYSNLFVDARHERLEEHCKRAVAWLTR